LVAAFRASAWKLASQTVAALKDAHAVLHFLWDAVIAHDRTGIAETTALPLNNKAPERLAGILDEPGPRIASRLLITIMVEQRRQRRFERAAGSTQRSGLFLRDLIIKRSSRGSGAGA
jgi:hypothetical protein